MGERPGRLLLFFLPLVLVASMTAVADDAIPAGILDDGGAWVFSDPWRYRPGDNSAWISPELDDLDWLQRTTTFHAHDPAWDGWQGVGWFRHRFSIDPDLVGTPLALRTRHAGSLLVFVDGKAIEPGRADLVLDGGTEHIIVVRYVNSEINAYHRADYPAGFEVVVSGSGASRNLGRHLRVITGLQLFLTAFPMAIALVHLTLFFFMPTNRGNLVYSALLILWAATVFFDYQAAMASSWTDQLINLRIQRVACGVRDIVLLALVYSVLLPRFLRRFWTLTAAMGAAAGCAVLKPDTNQWLLICVGAVVLGEVVRTVVWSYQQGRRDARFFAVGIAALAAFGSYDVLLDLGAMAPIAGIYNAYYVGYLVFLGCMSVYLARDYSHTHRRVFEQQRAARDREREMERLAAENQRKTRELEEARELQLSMLPGRLPELPQLRIGAAMKTATEVGGDYYDLHVDPSGELTVVIGDATGHGMRAGTLVVAVKSMFSAIGGSLPPADFLQRCSTLIKNLNLGRMHMAMMVVKISGRTARFAAAGIPPALIYRAETGVADDVSLHGLPLGTGMDPTYEEQEAHLTPGDTILLSTDGLAELNDPQGNALSYDGVAEAFAAAASKAPAEIVGELLAKADSWRDGATQEDDITCVALQWRA